MRLRLRDILPLLLVLAWGFAAFGLLVYALAEPHREAWLAALSALAALGLSWWVWKPGPKPWGSLPLIVLTALPLVYAVWWASPWSPFVALPAVLILALQPATRRPVLPPERARLGALLVVSYLALAPPLDAAAFGPPEPPAASVEAQDFTVDEETRQRLGAGGGSVWEQRLAREGSPNVSLMRVTVDARDNLTEALRQRYAPGRAEGAVFFWPFPFAITSEERRAEAADLAGDWDRVAVVHRSTFVFFLFPFPMSEGERQLVLLRPVQTEARPSLLPPFAVAWQEYAGYRVFEEGDNAGALRLLDGRVTVGRVVLSLPADAYSDLEVGPLRTPGLGLMAVLGAAGVAAVTRRARAWRAHRPSQKGHNPERRSPAVQAHAPRRAYFEARAHLPEALLKEYARFFAGCRVVLDVGCGSNLLKRHLPQVVGIDVARASRADVLADVFRLPFRDGSVDGLLAKDLLEHMLEPWRAVDEFRRVLAKGGKLRIEVPTPHYARFWDDYTHVRPYTARALTEMLRDHGLEPVRVHAYCGQGLPGFGLLGAEGTAMRINDALAKVGLRRPTNLVAEVVG